MLEATEKTSVLNGSFPQLPSCFGDCSSEEELSVLPRHTKVVVTGNNRTKSVLVGLQGVVKKAVGLGGWHWLVLTNGMEVKLQRNALTVIEGPTGNEEEDDEIEVQHHTQWNPADMISEGNLKPNKSKERRHRSARLSQKATKSYDLTPPLNNMKVDLSKLDMSALLRYYRHFNLFNVLPNPTKEQLIDIIERHFMSQEMDELHVIMGFVQAASGMKKKPCKPRNTVHN